MGRALDEDGTLVGDAVRQEHYMEARLQVPRALQEQLVQAAQRAGSERFELPDLFAEALVHPAFLGQLDVNPSGEVPGSQNHARDWSLHGQQTEADDNEILRIRIEGRSNVEGGQSGGNRLPGDGRDWEHRVTLQWLGYVDIHDGRVAHLVMLAAGSERLRWGNRQLKVSTEPDARHLMAGHPIDLDCGVRYGLTAKAIR